MEIKESINLFVKNWGPLFTVQVDLLAIGDILENLPIIIINSYTDTPTYPQLKTKKKEDYGFSNHQYKIWQILICQNNIILTNKSTHQ